MSMSLISVSSTKRGTAINKVPSSCQTNMRSFTLARSMLLLMVATMINTAEAFDWKDDWKINNWGNDAYCQTNDKVCVSKDKKGKCKQYDYEKIPKKHAGKDKSAPEGYYVYVTRNLYYVAKHEYTSGWKTGVFMQTTDNSSSSNKTFSVLHLKDVPSFCEGQNLNGQLIGRVANTPGGPHVHIAYRKASYYSNKTVAWAGALPPSKCSRHRDGYPDFPESFESPDTSIISIEKNRR